MRLITLIVALLFFSACTSKNPNDPLKNSKKLILKGHTSLYNNGMLEIPYTTIKLIPAAISSENLARSLIFQDARAALQKGLKDALDSVYIIPEGTKKAYEFSNGIYKVADNISDDIHNFTRDQGVYLIEKSSTLAKEHIVDAFSKGYTTGVEVYSLGTQIKDFFNLVSKDILNSHWSRTQEVFNSSMDISGDINDMSQKWAKEDFEFGINSFITGYTVLPHKLNNNIAKVSDKLTTVSFKEAYDSAESTRGESSLYFTDIVSDAFSNYTKETNKSFSKATQNFGANVEREGLIFTSLKSMRWLLQAIFYDGMIIPLSKLTVGSIGFVSVNGVIYPIHLLAGGTTASTMVLVEITAQTAQSTYDIVAPSITFAFASLLSSTEYLGGKTIAGGTAIIGTAVSGVDATAGLVLSGASKVSSVVVGDTVKYIGVPLALSSRVVGEISYGLVASASSTIAGSGMLVGGEIISTSILGTGAIASTTSLVAGTSYSVASAAAQGIYHLSEASLLPIGYSFMSGTVLGYGTLSQLQAHTILAASDAAYIVLSLEGPKWVLYSLSGDSIEDNKALPAGAIVDLKKMHENNETIKKLDVSSQEIEKILQALDKDLATY